jgi:hypothetical protein
MNTYDVPERSAGTGLENSSWYFQVTDTSEKYGHFESVDKMNLL